VTSIFAMSFRWSAFRPSSCIGRRIIFCQLRERVGWPSGFPGRGSSLCPEDPICRSWRLEERGRRTRALPGPGLHKIRRRTEPESVLATVLFTDLVGSTVKAAELGDARLSRLLEQHNTRIRSQLSHFRGYELDTAGDGFFARFDGPARAIRCACAIRDALSDLDLEVRTGLHTGNAKWWMARWQE